MTTIKLLGLDFYAHHGYYKQERQIGNKYTIDIELTLSEVNFTDDMIEKTVNYEEVYQIISQTMATPTMLLETLASKLSDQILHQFALVQVVKSSVSKHNPPIKGVCRQANVVIEKKRW